MLMEEKRLEGWIFKVLRQEFRWYSTVFVFFKALSDSEKKTRRSWPCTVAQCLGYGACKIIAVRGKNLVIWDSKRKYEVLGN